jgi:hypothetical protein
VALGDAKEVVAEINGGFGTLYIKRGSSDQLMTVREKHRRQDARLRISTSNTGSRDGIGYLTDGYGHQRTGRHERPGLPFQWTGIQKNGM